MAHPRTVKPNPIIQDIGILFTSRTIRGAITTITIAPDFKTGEAERDKQNTQVVNLQSSCLACSLYFLIEFCIIRKQPTGQEQRDDSGWNINEENPAQREAVGDPAAEGRPDGRCVYDRHAVKRKSSRTLGGRKRIYEDRLLDWGQASSGDALEQSEKDQ